MAGMRKIGVSCVVLAVSVACFSQAPKTAKEGDFLGRKLGTPLLESERCGPGDDRDEPGNFCWEPAPNNPYIVRRGDVYLNHLSGMEGFPVWGSLVDDRLEQVWIVMQPESAPDLMKSLTVALGRPARRSLRRYTNKLGGVWYGVNASWKVRGLFITFSERGNGGDYGWIVAETPAWGKRIPAKALTPF